jgi:hypothetical protein
MKISPTSNKGTRTAACLVETGSTGGSLAQEDTRLSTIRSNGNASSFRERRDPRVVTMSCKVSSLSPELEVGDVEIEGRRVSAGRRKRR